MTNPVIEGAGAPRFSIVIPHFDGSISDTLLLRGLDSLAQQTLRDFEILLYHDGPLSRPLPDLSRFREFDLKVAITERRHNDWGHSLRNLGIHAARGDYIVHFNPDNVLFPQALATIDAATRAPVEPAAPEWRENPDVIVCAIYLYGERHNGRYRWRDRANPAGYKMLLTGYPAKRFHIDALQVVVRRRLWLEIGGWYDKREEADGFIFEALIGNRGARYVPDILGEHW